MIVLNQFIVLSVFGGTWIQQVSYYAGNIMETEVVPDFIKEFILLFPPKLAKDFYPNGLTREKLLERLSEAIQKTGVIDHDEVWEGVIKITGDLSILPDITVIIKPGTIVFISARSDDQSGASGSAPQDLYNPKDPVKTEDYARNRVSIMIKGSLVAKGTEELPMIITSDTKDPKAVTG